jgi:hypothetical protein
MNEKRAAWEKLYRAQKEADDDRQRCRLCLGWASKWMLVPHHPRGRHGKNILNYFWVHQIPCHQWIHDNPEEATGLGLMTPNR